MNQEIVDAIIVLFEDERDAKALLHNVSAFEPGYVEAFLNWDASMNKLARALVEHKCDVLSGLYYVILEQDWLD